MLGVGEAAIASREGTTTANGVGRQGNNGMVGGLFQLDGRTSGVSEMDASSLSGGAGPLMFGVSGSNGGGMVFNLGSGASSGADRETGGAAAYGAAGTRQAAGGKRPRNVGLQSSSWL